MAYIDNYPNGWKDGYSSADDPDRALNDSAVEEIARANVARYDKHDSLEKQRERERAAAIERQTQKNIEAANRLKEEQQWRNEHRENIDQAVKIMVQKKKDEYNQKSWIGKAFAKLRKRSPKNKEWISDTKNTARDKAIKMTPEQLERYIERYNEKNNSGGKSR